MAEQFGRLGSQVIGAGMVDGEYREAGVVTGVPVVLTQRDPCSLGQMTDGAFAHATAIAGLDSGQSQIGTQAGGCTVLESVGAGRIVDFQTRQFAVVGNSRGLGARGDQGLVVPTGQCHRIGCDKAGFLPGLHSVRGFGGIVAVEADDRLGAGRQLGFAVENDQLVPSMRGIVTGLGVLVVFKAKRQPFFDEKTTDEVIVGFPVLRRDAVGAQGLGNQVGPVGFRVVGKNLADNIDNRFVLE